jgi:protein SCO1/2
MLLALGCAGQRPAPLAARPVPLALFDRTWSDEAGARVTFASFGGAPLILTMIYRTCRSRCPMTIHKLEQVAAAFRMRGVLANFVLVTLDPVQDTPARLAAFKQEQGLDAATFHLLSGELSQTRELAKFLRVRAAYDDFHIDHEVRTAVFDGTGRLVLNLEGWSFPDALPVSATTKQGESSVKAD